MENQQNMETFFKCVNFFKPDMAHKGSFFARFLNQESPL